MTLQLPITLKKTSSFESYMTYVTSLPMLSETQEKALFKKYQEHNDLNAVQEIVLSHLRFVGFIARSFKGYGLPIEDLVQEGSIGLMKSIKKFRLDFGVRLSSFAVHYIKGEIQEFVIRNWRLVKATTTKAKRKLFFNLRRLKTNTEWLEYSDKTAIAESLGVSVEDVTEMEVQLTQSDVFIDSSTKNDDENSSFICEKLLEDKTTSLDSQIIREDFSDKAMAKIYSAIKDLDDRSRDIITQRWLSDDKKPHKYFAAKYKVSQERIRQVEEKALATIKNKLYQFH
ncbi:RNA polymerase factor sigma-32 [Thalassotalea piscium]|uniref:RNA polymerase sigma-32 factor n=1 Tax=Thalassotalea piscium TaxID=1230533 RepID=A0A7X0NIQ5_9GAMM|nr:RNA polymerase factor sigma-32 [Thalassotalea piscium]MBB6544203.1 RNA polymerase sigma-32 factor [Thalassotalea piscium]